MKIKKILKKSLFILIFSLFFIFVLTDFAKAERASLSIYPQGGTFTVGNTFDVSVFLNTGGRNVNAVKVDLKFDPEKLQVITPAKGLSAVGVWVFPPSFSNTKGEISLQGGFSEKGINTSEGLVSVIVFEAIASGKTEVTFFDSSQVLVGGEEGTNILTSINRAVYDIIPAPSKGTRIFSETHPDQNRWYKNNSPVFSWEKVEGATGYSYKLDEDPYGEPENTINTELTSVSFENIKEGVLFFHLKAKKEKCGGGTSHYKINVDTTPPVCFKPYLEPFSLTSGNYLFFYFNTIDLLSGIDHYEVRIADFTDPKNVTLSGWIRQESPFRFTTERSGTFRVLVRAFDKANNFQEGEIQAKVFSPPLIIGSGGIQIIGLFLPWWLIYIIFGSILIFGGFKIFSLIKKRNLFKRLKKEVAEAEKEIEDVKKLEKRIHEMRVLEEEAGKEAERLAERLKNKE